jgi:hypothetical protein
MKSPLYHVTRELLQPFELGGEALADIQATLDAVDPKLPVFLASLGVELGLAPREWMRRGVAILLMFAATQLADDLADGDCCYLEAPQRRGPGTEWLLHQLSAALLLESSIERDAITASLRDLAQVGSAQALEVRRSQWDLDSSRFAALGLNGKQWSAYLRLFADGTQYAGQAARWGEAWGIGLHVAGDRTSQDARFTTLSTPAKRDLADWALEHVALVMETPLATLQRSAGYFRAVLQQG